MRRPALQTLVETVRSSQMAGPILLALAIGAGAGLASVAFHLLIGSMSELFLGGFGGLLRTYIGAAFPIVVLACGGLLVGIIVRYLSPETKGHGIPEVIVAVAYKGGHIPIGVSLFRALAAAVCIGSGGSGGPEGPIAQIGAGVGSSLGRWFQLNDRRVILCVACGAAGGIAATFNAPVAGVIFALEVILARFSANAFGIVVISSITATVVQRLVTGHDTPAFAITQSYALSSAWELPLYAILGILGAMVAQALTRTLYGVEAIADRIRVPLILKPAIGGALVGAIGIYEPRILSTGYKTIEEALGGQLSIAVLGTLCVLKLTATSLTVGSGGSAGVFAPSLFIGAMFGGFFGNVAHVLFPTVTQEHGAYALAGMAAVFAGSAHAPITAVLMLFEMTDSYDMILPLMAASVLSLLVSQRISEDSIYTLKLRRQGMNVRAVQDIDLMDSITVGEAMERNFESVPATMPLTALIMKFAAREHNGYPVVDAEGSLYGIVTMSDVNNAVIDKSPDLVTVGDICARNVYVIRPDQSLTTALTQFGAHNVARLPVVDPASPGRVIGMLGPADIVKSYVAAYGRTQEQIRKVDTLHGIRERSSAVIEQDTIRSGSPLAGKLVKDAGFPTGTTLVSIMRGNQMIVPRGTTPLHFGDVLMVLSNRDKAAMLRDWLREKC